MDTGRPVQARDRAAVVATSIISIITDALRRWLRGEPADLAGVRTQIESLLRDEFADIERQIAGERTLADCEMRPPVCIECGVNRADPPSKMCPGCQAYREHQQ
jgi:rubrerythrin